MRFMMRPGPWVGGLIAKGRRAYRATAQGGMPAADALAPASDGIGRLGQLNLRVAALARRIVGSISFFVWRSNSRRVDGIGRIPCGLKLSVTPVLRRAFSVSR